MAPLLLVDQSGQSSLFALDKAPPLAAVSRRLFVCSRRLARLLRLV